MGSVVVNTKGAPVNTFFSEANARVSPSMANRYEKKAAADVDTGN